MLNGLFILVLLVYPVFMLFRVEYYINETYKIIRRNSKYAVLSMSSFAYNVNLKLHNGGTNSRKMRVWNYNSNESEAVTLRMREHIYWNWFMGSIYIHQIYVSIKE